jgi:hypothetical protein
MPLFFHRDRNTSLSHGISTIKMYPWTFMGIYNPVFTVGVQGTTSIFSDNFSGKEISFIYLESAMVQILVDIIWYK